MSEQKKNAAKASGISEKKTSTSRKKTADAVQGKMDSSIIKEANDTTRQVANGILSNEKEYNSKMQDNQEKLIDALIEQMNDSNTSAAERKEIRDTLVKLREADAKKDTEKMQENTKRLVSILKISGVALVAVAGIWNAPAIIRELKK